MTSRRCNLHRKGITPTTPPFFEPGCVVCEAKAAKDPNIRNAPRPQLPARQRAARRTYKHLLGGPFSAKTKVVTPL